MRKIKKLIVIKKKIDFYLSEIIKTLIRSINAAMVIKQF